MKYIARALICMIALALLPSVAGAQDDPFGVPDTIWADVARLDDQTMTISISFFNDEYVGGLAVPLKFEAGTHQIVADSAVYAGGRVAEAEWTIQHFRADTAIQCVTLGMIADIGPTDHKLYPGKGHVATIYVSSLEDRKIENFTVDTTTTDPGNQLMAVSHRMQGEPPDTVAVDVTGRTIFPQWVIRYAEE